MSSVTEVIDVGKKGAKPGTGTPEPKRYGTLVRVSDAFATAARELAVLRGESMAEMADTVLAPIVERMRAEEMRKRLGKK